MKKEIVITLSPENENKDIQDIEDLMSFIINELENVNIGAFLELREVATS